jgi:hypothetical protein
MFDWVGLEESQIRQNGWDPNVRTRKTKTLQALQLYTIFELLAIFRLTDNFHWFIRFAVLTKLKVRVIFVRQQNSAIENFQAFSYWREKCMMWEMSQIHGFHNMASFRVKKRRGKISAKITGVFINIENMFYSVGWREWRIRQNVWDPNVRSKKTKTPQALQLYTIFELLAIFSHAMKF